MGLLEIECNANKVTSIASTSATTPILNDKILSSLPNFTSILIRHIALIIDYSPYYALQWLCTLVSCNETVHVWCLANFDLWVKQYLVNNKQTNIRFSVSMLLANLVPNKHFRDTFTSNRNMFMPYRRPLQPDEAAVGDAANQFDLDLNDPGCRRVLHRIVTYLLTFIDMDLCAFIDKEQNSNNSRLVQYFTLLTYFMVGEQEKLLFKPYIEPFWSLFHPAISNVHTVSNLNKQAALHFFYHAISNCDENVNLILSSAKVERELPMVTIAVDHEDTELIQYNRNCLHVYYGVIRICMQQSQEYARQMCQHANFTWAFRHILPYSVQYPLAVQEFFKCIELFVDNKEVSVCPPPVILWLSSDFTRSEPKAQTSQHNLKQIVAFKEGLFSIFSHDIDIKASWQSLVQLVKLLIDTNTDLTVFIMHKKALGLITCAFVCVFNMHQEATACSMNQSLLDVMSVCEVFLQKCKFLVHADESSTVHQNSIKFVVNQQWKEKYGFQAIVPNESRLLSSQQVFVI
jgi:ubiquitin carboxyl-terminal hydrolase 34